MGSGRTVLISILAVLVFYSARIRVAHACEIVIVNQCSYAVTTCAQSAQNDITRYQIGSGASQIIDFGSACSWPQGAIWPSVTGQCANPPGSPDATDKNLANFAEFTIGGADGTDIYDLSNVDAYAIGLGISVTSSAGGQCSNIQCVINDIRAFCMQGDNKLVTEPSDITTCINTDGTAGRGPTPDTNYFHVACPEALSYPGDTSVEVTCNTGSDYQVTFCP